MLKSFFPSPYHHNIAGDTLEQLITATLPDKVKKRRAERRSVDHDHSVCVTHDPAPVSERAFGVKPKELRGDKGICEKGYEPGGFGQGDVISV